MTGFWLRRGAATLFLLGYLWPSAVRAFENGWCEHRSRIRGSPKSKPTTGNSHDPHGPSYTSFHRKSRGLAASVPPSRHPNTSSTPAGVSSSSPSTRGSKIPPPLPLSLPVWSLAVPTSEVLDKDGAKDSLETNAPRTMATPTSMNIVTYAMAASVAPPKLWVVSLYHGTQTKDSFDAAGWGVLQLLRPRHAPLVEVLGKRSGYDPGVDKAADCANRGCDWIPGNPWEEGTGTGSDSGPPLTDPGTGGARLLHLLPGCAAYVRVRSRGQSMPAGDHAVVLCEVTGMAHWDDALGAVVADDAADGKGGLPDALDDATVLYTGALRRNGLL